MVMVRAIFMAGFRVGVPGTDVWRMYRRVRVSTKIKPPDSRLVNITAVFVEGGVLNEQDPSETFSQPNDHALCGRLFKGCTRISTRTGKGVLRSVYNTPYIAVRRATRQTYMYNHPAHKHHQIMMSQPRRFFCFPNILDPNVDGIHTRTAEAEQLVCISRRHMPRHTQQCNAPPPFE